jgi:ribonuclease P protein component
VALSPQNKISLKEYREKFFESGRSVYAPLLQVIVIKNNNSSHSGLASPDSLIGDPESIPSSLRDSYSNRGNPVPQFAVSIGKKIAKKAHDRNKLRRQVQQLIQENLPSFPPYKYLFLPKKPALDSYPDLLDSFNQLLSKLK